MGSRVSTAAGVKLIVVGFRRSGTTLFWRLFCEDERFVSLDEPFKPLFRDPRCFQDPEPDSCEAHLLDALKATGAGTERIAVMDPASEIGPSLSPAQRAYFAQLLQSGPRVLIEDVRIHFKLRELHALAPDAHLIHLHRAPAAVASSHLLPSGLHSWRASLADGVRKRAFWRRKWPSPHWGGRATLQQCLRQIEEKLPDSHRVDLRQAPGVAKLLAWWLVSYRAIEIDGRQLFGERFASLRYEDLCADPRASFKDIYGRLGLSMPAMSFASVRGPSRGFDPTNPRWDEWATRLGFDVEVRR